MKEHITEKIEFPEGTEFSINNNEITIKKNGKEAKKKVNLKNIQVRKDGTNIVLESKISTKREKKMINTIKAHLKNMVKGLDEEFTYKLAVVYLHFPITLDYDKTNNKLIIKNFLGEKVPRIAKIPKGAEIELGKNLITVTSYDKEIAGQAAANIERATKIRNRDRRKFQDGIFLTERPGGAI